MAITTDTLKTYVAAMVDSSVSETTIATYLDMAAAKIISILYPYGDGTEEVPTRYLSNQIDIAVYMINKRGAEGETTHKENGIDRIYGDADIPKSLLRGIVPMAEVPGE